jgi:undecaprenyl phosphate-alpha-L-ara4N flippase subunit ArnE
MLSASLLWFYVIKNYPLSIAYPLISFSYVFGAFAAMYFFDESISAIRWVGIVLIMVGATLLTKG